MNWLLSVARLSDVHSTKRKRIAKAAHRRRNSVVRRTVLISGKGSRDIQAPWYGPRKRKLSAQKQTGISVGHWQRGGANCEQTKGEKCEDNAIHSKFLFLLTSREVQVNRYVVANSYIDSNWNCRWLAEGRCIGPFFERKVTLRSKERKLSISCHSGTRRTASVRPKAHQPPDVQKNCWVQAT